MKLSRAHLALLLVNVGQLLVFGTVYLLRRNYEFVIYVGVIVFFLGVIGGTVRRVPYTVGSLVGLTVWAFLHMAGGSIFLGGTRLYEIILLPLSAKYPILRYDQFVHIWGFGASTLVMFCVLRPLLRDGLSRFAALSIVVVMAGLGVGAFNEVVEFFVAAAVPESGVGGYMNTSLDLVADLIGAMLGMVYVRWRYLGRDAP